MARSPEGSLRGGPVPTQNGKEAQPTPGPWRIFQTKGKPPFFVIGIGREDGLGITDGNVGLGIWGADSPEALANARLIAAAPDLAAALKELMDTLRVHAPGTTLNNHQFDTLGIRCNNALAKAGFQ